MLQTEVRAISEESSEGGAELSKSPACGRSLASEEPSLSQGSCTNRMIASVGPLAQA